MVCSDVVQARILRGSSAVHELGVSGIRHSGHDRENGGTQYWKREMVRHERPEKRRQGVASRSIYLQRKIGIGGVGY